MAFVPDTSVAASVSDVVLATAVTAPQSSAHMSLALR